MDKKQDRSPETAALVKKYRKQIAVTLILCLISIGVIAGATTAWYANNRKVSAANSNITSDTPTASLYIAKGTTKGTPPDYYTSVTASAQETTNNGLYPISTVNCKDWYYVTEWTPQPKADDTSGSLVPMASGYTKVESPAENGMAFTYTNAGKARVAYYKQPFTIYTDRDKLNVYLAGLTVTKNDGSEIEGNSREADLQSGLRVAITDAADNLLLYYAPNAENGIGNSMNNNPQPTKYYGIKGTGETEIQEISTTVYNSTTINDILAQQDTTDPNKYIVTDLTSYGEANTTGLTLNTYVWLEGTDAETLGHITGGISNPVSVTFTFVGVEPTTTP